MPGAQQAAERGVDAGEGASDAQQLKQVRAAAEKGDDLWWEEA